MKTSVTKKESPGNLEEILRVKPKVEIVYQAIKYTGTIYMIFIEYSMDVKYNSRLKMDGMGI